MKLTKKITSIVLSFALFLSLFVSMGQQTEAASSVSALKKAVPSKVRIWPNTQYTYGGVSSNTTIFVPYASFDNCIANIKVSNKALKVRTTKEYKVEESMDTYPYYGIIGLYASKEGTYKVSFDVLKKKGGAKLYSKTVTVYAKSDEAISYVKYAGKKNPSGVQRKAKGKLNVKLNKGYKLKSIRVGVYTRNKAKDEDYSNEYSTSWSKSQNSSLTYKTVKNNAMITLGTKTNYDESYSYTKSESYYDIYHSFSDTILAPTHVEITYIDKYSKQPCTATYTLYRFAK